MLSMEMCKDDCDCQGISKVGYVNRGQDMAGGSEPNGVTCK